MYQMYCLRSVCSNDQKHIITYDSSNLNNLVSSNTNLVCVRQNIITENVTYNVLLLKSNFPLENIELEKYVLLLTNWKKQVKYQSRTAVRFNYNIIITLNLPFPLKNSINNTSSNSLQRRV